MALSKRKTCLAVLRQITQLDAVSFAAMIGRSHDWLKKAESGKIPVTPEIQRVIALESGVNLVWLHQADPTKPCVDLHGDQYTLAFFLAHRESLKAGKPDMLCACNPCGWLLQIAAIAEAAGEKMKIDLFANELDQFLNKLAKKHGSRFSACDRHVKKMDSRPELFLWLISDKGGQERAEDIIKAFPIFRKEPWTFNFIETRKRSRKIEADEFFEKNPALNPRNKQFRVQKHEWIGDNGKRCVEEKLVATDVPRQKSKGRRKQASGLKKIPR